MTFLMFSQNWLKNYVLPKNKKSTYNQYKKQLRLHILPFWGEVQLKDFKSGSATDYLTYLKGKQISDNTIKNIICIFKNMLAKAKKLELIAENFSEFLPSPKVCEKQIYALSEVEQKGLEQYILNSGKPK